MGRGISEVLPFAVGVAISPVPIIAVILMLFSVRARVNGPLFLLGWVIGLAVACAVVYLLADAEDVSTDSSSADAVSWGKLLLGAVLLLLAARQWRSRPRPGEAPELPKWMAGIDTLQPAKAVGLGVLLSALNPKNLILAAAAAAGVAQLGLSGVDAFVSLAVFVVLGSLTIVGPVAFYLLGGERAARELDELKTWLAVHNAAVMTVLFLVLGAALIAKGLAPLTS
jgi:hypothetical protein